MAIMTEEVALKFCELCNWVYESWITHKALFENNRNKENNIGRCAQFTSRLSIVTQEYSLQQIAKLHDRAVQGASTNLTIDYVMTFGEWGERKDEVEEIAARLDGLKERIIPARNKILSHNDLITILENQPLGGFPEGDDEDYFEALQDLVNVVHDRWRDGPYPFNDLAEADVHEFLHLLEAGR